MKKIAKIGLLLLAMTFASAVAFAQLSVGINISARIAPPALPVYAQPPCPVEGYLWTPGYWAYDNTDGYYWVPGVWVHPPRAGVLWTPAYWGFDGGIYSFHTGYWGRHIGFYGGINYGYGYGGSGFYGGRWERGAYRYNTAITNVNTTVIHNTYVNKTVINNNTVNNNRTSFNGRGGVNVQPGEQERHAMSEEHIQPTSSQLTHHQSAGQNRNQFANVNHGKPANSAMDRVNRNRFDERQGNGGKVSQPWHPGINRKAHNAQEQNRIQPRPHANPHRAENERRS
ncbi:YXWGXW repeat-containing protein [Pedobacter sp. NJ-S-72]